MGKQYKKISFVLLAILIGAGIIFLALKNGKETSIDGAQSNENGTWKDALMVIPQMFTSKTLGVSSGIIEMSTEEATTTTDIVARKLLLEYANSQKGASTAELSDTEAQNIAVKLSQEVKLPQKKDYSLSELNISTDNSYDANLLYVTSLSSLLREYVATGQKDTELTILLSAMTSKSQTKLEQLGPKVVIYQALIKNLLALKTPSRIASLHLRLINNYETLRSATVGLQSMLIDPAIGIAALAEYRLAFDDLFLTEKALREFNF